MPLLVLPLGISFFIFSLNLKKKSRGATLFGLIFLWIFSTGFVSEILWRLVEYPWIKIDERLASDADAIVVLSSGEMIKTPGKANIYEWKDPDRFFAGIKLFQAKKASKIFFTGGASPYLNAAKTQGELYKLEAMKLGIPSKSIFTTKRVINTTQEAFALRNYPNLRASSTEILLVTSAFHMQRAKKEFQRQGFIVHPFPVDFKTSENLSWRNPYKFIPNASSLAKTSLALRELLGRAIYRSW